MKINRGKYTQMDTVKQIKYEAAISEKNDANTNQSLKMRSVSRT